MRVFLTNGLDVAGETVNTTTDAATGGFNPLFIVLVGLIVLAVCALIFLLMSSKGSSSKNVKRNKKVAPKTASQQEKAKIKQQERELKKKNREAAENAARRKATGEPVELREIKLEDDEIRAQRERARLEAQEIERLKKQQELQDFELSQNYDTVDDDEENDGTPDDSFSIFDDEQEISEEPLADEQQLDEQQLDEQFDISEDLDIEDDEHQLDEQFKGLADLDIGEDEPCMEEDSVELLELDDDDDDDDNTINTDSDFGELLDVEAGDGIELEESPDSGLEESLSADLEEQNTASCGDSDTDYTAEELCVYLVTGGTAEAVELPEELKALVHSKHYTLLGAVRYRINNTRVESLTSLRAGDSVEVLCPVILSDTKEYSAEGSVLNFSGDVIADVSLIKGQNNVSGLKISFEVPIDMDDIDSITVALGFDTKDFTNDKIGLYCDVCIVNQ